jgi:diketogulonate reductase-like aldo/keto reductase
MAYSPFGHGALPGPAEPAGAVLEKIARRHGRTRHQVVLNWLARRPGLISIPKAVGEQHVRDNAGALGWEFDEEELAAIDRAFPPPSGPTPLGII